MNYSKIKIAAQLLVAGAFLITAGQSYGVTYNLRAGVTSKTMPDGTVVPMWGFADDTTAGAGLGTVVVPGPALTVPPGDTTLTINLNNTLPEDVSIVIPGQYGFVRTANESVDNDSAGPYAGRVKSLVHVAPALGGNAAYTWNGIKPGTFLYHSGSHAAVQVQMGLYGAMTAVVDASHAYPGVAFDSSVTLLFSEIDPDVHAAVAGATYGPGPSFQDAELAAVSASIYDGLHAATDPTYAYLYSLLDPDLQASLLAGTGDHAALVSTAISELLGGSSIYNPDVMLDSMLSAATMDALWSAPEVNQPTSPVLNNGFMVRLNRLLLTDALATASPAVVLPPVNTMTSTIRSYAQYFLVNGEAYNGIIGAGGNNIFPSAGLLPGSRVLLRMLNAGMDSHVPTLQNGGDLQFVAEDGQLAPYPRNSYSVFMAALKTVDAIFVAPALPVGVASQLYAVSDRRLGLVNGTMPLGGMLAYLNVGAAVVPVNPMLVVSPLNLSFTATVGGANPANQTFNISNGGSGALSGVSATVVTGSPWLTTSGGAGVGPVTVSATVGALAAGTYNGTISVAATGDTGVTGSPKTVSVSFVVVAAPVLVVAPTSLTFNAALGGLNPASQTFDISNGGGGTLSGVTTTVVTGSPWLTTSAGAGAGPVTVSVNLASLPVGTQPGTTVPGAITVSAAGVTGSPQTVNVSLNLAALSTPLIVAIDTQINTGGNANVGTTHVMTGIPAGALLVLTTQNQYDGVTAGEQDCNVTSGGNLTWTRRVDAGSTSHGGSAEIWTAPIPAGGVTGGTVTVLSRWGTARAQSSVCYVVTGQGGFAALPVAANTANNQSAPSVSITTTRANSLLFGVTSDYNHIDGSTRTYLDTATERLYFNQPGVTTAYHFTAPAATIGSYTEGLTAPTGQSAGTAVMEVRHP